MERPNASTSDGDARLAERRAARIARRAAQRAQNVIRARQMHAARLSHEACADPSGTRQGRAASVPAWAYIGCSGWYYRHWAEAFYPSGLPSSRWFDHYASEFRTVELNAPFYSWPSLTTVEVWNRQVGRRRFVYSIKVNELITHVKRLSRTDALVKDFGLIADLLGPRFGCFLFQLPPSLHYSKAALHRILRQLDPRRRNVVEFRHRSWWDERVFQTFRDSGTIFCSVSAPRLPDALIKTAADVYIRFHGKDRWYRHDYTRHELATWTERIGRCGAAHIWAYFNNDRQGNALKNAKELRRQLAGSPGKEAKID
jgi:uncharacterized protein YecE (DUF72 family)